MSTPCKEIEKLVLSQQINFGGNPVMRWMNSNVEIRRDPADNIKIDKSKSSEKVDGMVALAMAIGGYLTDINKGSVYDKRGILEI
jgi:phage terminase large subunit-like protein